MVLVELGWGAVLFIVLPDVRGEKIKCRSPTETRRSGNGSGSRQAFHFTQGKARKLALGDAHKRLKLKEPWAVALPYRSSRALSVAGT